MLAVVVADSADVGVSATVLDAMTDVTEVVAVVTTVETGVVNGAVVITVVGGGVVNGAVVVGACVVVVVGGTVVVVPSVGAFVSELAPLNVSSEAIVKNPPTSRQTTTATMGNT